MKIDSEHVFHTQQQNSGRLKLPILGSTFATVLLKQTRSEQTLTQ